MSQNSQPPTTTEFGIEIAPDIFDRRDKWNYMLMGALAIGVARFPEALNPDLSIRNFLPEPIDVPDHIGNVAAMGTFVFAAFRGWLRASDGHAKTREWFNKDLRRTQIFIGSVTLAANAFGELVGYGSYSTPDPLDAAYGLAGGYIFYRACKPEFLPETEIDRVLAVGEDLGEDVEKLEPQYQEVLTRFGAYKQHINALRERIRTTKKPSSGAKKSAKPAGQTSRATPRASKRYTPPKKNRK